MEADILELTKIHKITIGISNNIPRSKDKKKIHPNQKCRLNSKSLTLKKTQLI